MAEAYGGDLDRAAADSDERVAAMVAAWERRHGLPVTDWAAIGRDRDEYEGGSRADLPTGDDRTRSCSRTPQAVAQSIT